MQMLWNWDTIDTCFISSTWHIRSSGMFVGSCVGIVGLVMMLEFLRRCTKEYDRYLIRHHGSGGTVIQLVSQNDDQNAKQNNDASPVVTAEGFRPTLLQQIIRAALYMLQFAVAYFVML